MSHTVLPNRYITALLRAWGDGNGEALDSLVPLVYDELHRQAHRYLRGERPNHTLQTSALINEAYLRLAGQRDVEWQNRTHFFGIAANIMRRVLVDYART
jgi:RNA polymerase sigma factor (TIGR02999 family)